jgi:hypothetical protein
VLNWEITTAIIVFLLILRTSNNIPSDVDYYCDADFDKFMKENKAKLKNVFQLSEKVDIPQTKV